MSSPPVGTGRGTSTSPTPLGFGLSITRVFGRSHDSAVPCWAVLNVARGPRTNRGSVAARRPRPAPRGRVHATSDASRACEQGNGADRHDLLGCSSTSGCHPVLQMREGGRRAGRVHRQCRPLAPLDRRLILNAARPSHMTRLTVTIARVTSPSSTNPTATAHSAISAARRCIRSLHEAATCTTAARPTQMRPPLRRASMVRCTSVRSRPPEPSSAWSRNCWDWWRFRSFLSAWFSI